MCILHSILVFIYNAGDGVIKVTNIINDPYTHNIMYLLSLLYTNYVPTSYTIGS